MSREGQVTAGLTKEVGTNEYIPGAVRRKEAKSKAWGIREMAGEEEDCDNALLFFGTGLNTDLYNTQFQVW